MSDGRNRINKNRSCRRPRFNLWVGKIPWRRKWQPTPVFLPGKSHGQRSLVGYMVHGVAKSQTGLSTQFRVGKISPEQVNGDVSGEWRGWAGKKVEIPTGDDGWMVCVDSDLWNLLS